MTTSLRANSPSGLHGHFLNDDAQTGPSDGGLWLNDGSPSLSGSGFSFAAPSPAYAATPAQTLYLIEAADTVAISVNDIHQGQIGDCFLLSAIGELALWHPDSIKNMIKVNTNGTEKVSLWGDAKGGTAWFGTSSFKLATQVVTNRFAANGVNNGASEDVVGTQKEIWPQVIEKAYAQANGGYAGIQNGGYPTIALQALTGHSASWQSPAGVTVADLQAHLAASDLVIMDTGAGSAKYNLFGNHAYMFEGLVTSGSETCVKLGNPWGCNQPSLIPVSQLANAVAEIDVGHWH